MTPEILLVFAVIFGALYLFLTEKLPVDMTAFAILIVLMLLGVIYPDSFPNIQEGLSGFSNEATMTVLSMFILSSGVQKTGIIHRLSKNVFSFVGNSEFRQILAIGLLVAPISGFVNNTAAVAIMLPMVLDLAKRSKVPATKLLIPLSFFGMLGGTLTLIGTSTNILAVSILKNTPEQSIPEIGMFDFTALGAVVLLVGFLYFLTIGRFLLPSRKNKDDASVLPENDVFVTEVVLQKESQLIGSTLKSIKFEEKNDVKILRLIREKKSFIKNLREKPLEQGDILMVEAKEQRIIDLTKKENVTLLHNFDESERRRPDSSGEIIKVLLRGVQAFHNRPLADIPFMRRFSLAVVGIQSEEVSSQRLRSLKMHVGQVLLVQASLSSLKKLQYSKDILLLETIEEEYTPEKMFLSLLIVGAVILSSAFLGIPIVISALTGVMAMFLTRCINTEELYASVNWEIIFLLAGVIPLGIALQKSGAAAYIANGIVFLTDNRDPFLVLVVFYLVTTFLTELISNNASVALLVPIAVSVAAELSMNPFPIVLSVMFAASTSFLTPVGYQTNTMVYGSGNYRFSDFLRVGAPLNIILFFVTTSLIWFWWIREESFLDIFFG